MFNIMPVITGEVVTFLYSPIIRIFLYTNKVFEQRQSRVYYERYRWNYFHVVDRPLIYI